MLLAAGGMWAGAWLALQGRDRSLALVVGTSSLALVAVATAELVSDDGLTLAWAAQAILLSVLATRLRDARLQAGGLAYLALATGHALVVDAPPSLLFDPVRADTCASIALAAVALAALVAGVVAPARHVVATETGVLAFLASVRTFLGTHRSALQETLVFSAGVLGVLASAVFLTGIAFDAGHVAATAIAAAAGAAALAVAARRRSTGLIVASLVALLVVLGESIYDVGELARVEIGRSADCRWSSRRPGCSQAASHSVSSIRRRAGWASSRAPPPPWRSVGRRSGSPSSRPRTGTTSRARRGWESACWSPRPSTRRGRLGLPRAEAPESLDDPWALGLVALLAAEGFLLQDGRAFAAAAALTGASSRSPRSRCAS